MAEVYCIVNTQTGHEYVGYTVRKSSARWRRHVTDCHRYNSHFSRAIRKYGAESFSLIVLHQDLSAEEARLIEIEEISVRKPHYNMTTGGDGVPGYRHTEEVCQAVSKRFLGKKLSPEHREKIRSHLLGPDNPSRGRPCPDHVKIAVGNAARGRVHSAEEIEKRRAKMIGRKLSDAHREAFLSGLRTSVRCDPSGIVYPSINAASESTGVPRKRIRISAQRLQIDERSQLRFYYVSSKRMVTR